MANGMLIFLIVIGFGAAIGIPIWFISQFFGSKPTQAQRKAEFFEAFDGSPEIRVRFWGTGMTEAETMWWAEQYGYRVSAWPTSRAPSAYVTMQRVGPPKFQFQTLHPPHPPSPLPPFPQAGPSSQPFGPDTNRPPTTGTD